MAYGDFKYLPRITYYDKILCDKAILSAKNVKNIKNAKYLKYD